MSSSDKDMVIMMVTRYVLVNEKISAVILIVIRIIEISV